jgi:hypothetical protein
LKSLKRAFPLQEDEDALSRTDPLKSLIDKWEEEEEAVEAKRSMGSTPVPVDKPLVPLSGSSSSSTTRRPQISPSESSTAIAKVPPEQEGPLEDPEPLSVRKRKPLTSNESKV